MSAHRYWRVNITADAGGIASMGEITMATSIGGTSLLFNPALASSDQGAGFDAYKAFDGNNTTYWGATAALPAWWQYRFASAIVVAEVRIQNMSYTGPSYMPDTWDLQSSPDGVTFTTVQSYTSAAWTAFGIQTFAVPASTAEPYWRVLVHTNGAGQYASLAEIAMASVAGGVNLVINNAFATSAQAGHLASAAIDGNSSTYWGASGSLPQAWSYDFGPTYAPDIVEIAITDLSLNSGYAPTGFDLQSSDDNSTWTTVQSFVPGSWTSVQTQTFDVTGGGGGGATANTPSALFLI